MSAQEIVLTDEVGKRIRVRKSGDGFLVTLPNRFGTETNAYFTRQHAHLLYLFLKEHLEGSPA